MFLSDQTRIDVVTVKKTRMINKLAVYFFFLIIKTMSQTDKEHTFITQSIYFRFFCSLFQLKGGETCETCPK
jgi:hypothetical protein